MIKWIVVIITLTIGTAGGLYLYSTQQSENKTVSAGFLDDIPSDTVYYFGGKGNKELATFFSNSSFASPLPSQSLPLQTNDASASPQEKFLNFFITKFSSLSNQSTEDISTQIGIDPAGDYAIYSHGISPVIRFQLSSASAFLSLIDEAVAESGWQYQEQVFDTSTIRLWLVSTPEDPTDIYLSISTHKNFASFAFISDDASDQVKWERLGLAKPTTSIATTEEISELKTQYQLDGSAVGFIHFERIAKGLLDPTSNSFGKEIQQYLPEDMKLTINEKLTPECRQDYANIAAAVPKYVGGIQKVSQTESQVSLDLISILELSNTGIIDELSKLRGHIPSYTLNPKNAIFSFGLGISLDQLTPVLTNLWTQFTNASFTCTELIDLQAKAQQANPAMLAMFLGMVQGVEGVGASFQEISFTQGSPIPENLSFIASIAAKNPEILAGLTQMIPMGAGIQIPTDGTLAEIPHPILPPSISIYAGIKGNHLVMFSGEGMKATADAMGAEALTQNGIYSIGVDYRRIKDLMQLNLGKTMGASQCITQQEMIHTFSQLPMSLQYTSDVTSNGFEDRIKVEIDAVEHTQLTLPGKYTLEVLNELCQWETSGVDEISEDGSGRYVETDPEGQCEIFLTEYSWKYSGNKIQLTPTREASRNNCDEEFEEHDLDPYDCFVMNQEESRFQCLFSANTEDATLYRYTPM